MRRKIFLGFLVLSLTSFAAMEIERGYGDIEVSSSYYNIKSKGEKEANPYKEIHDFINNQNTFITNQGENYSWDKENIIRPYIAGGAGKKSSNAGGGFLFLHSYDEGAFIGFQAEARNVKFKIDNENIKGTRGVVKFIFDRQGENGSRLLLTPYYIFDNVKEFKNKVVGAYLRQEIPLDLSKYNLPEEGIKAYLDFDVHRAEVKKQKDMKFNKNDSSRAGIGLSYSPIIETDNMIIKPSLSVGYEREFLENRKYKALNVKEENLDVVKASVKVTAEYKNVEFGIENSFLKSTNTSNYENRISAHFTVKF